MERLISFLTLSTVSLLAVLVIALSAALAHVVGNNEAQTSPYVDPLVMGDSTPSRCASIFRILDGNQDGYISKHEARKSAETTASWKSLDKP